MSLYFSIYSETTASTSCKSTPTRSTTTTFMTFALSTTSSWSGHGGISSRSSRSSSTIIFESSSFCSFQIFFTGTRLFRRSIVCRIRKSSATTSRTLTMQTTSPTTTSRETFELTERRKRRSALVSAVNPRPTKSLCK